MWEERWIHLLDQHAGDMVVLGRTQMPTHPRQGTKARQRQCVTPLPRCNADIKTPERTTSVGDLSPCNAITSRLPEGKSGLRGRFQMMERLPVSHGKFLPWLNCLPANQREGGHKPLSSDGAHLRTAELHQHNHYHSQRVSNSRRKP